MARVVIPGIPHHIIQRGNRLETVFFDDYDREEYINLLLLYAKPAGIDFWAYCLMDNHIHLIAVPQHEKSFAQGFSEAHKRYARMINFRKEWRGHFWESRFKSHPLSEQHLYAAVRYVERNPVRARMVDVAQDYRWSSARAHVYSKKDKLLDDNFLTQEIKDWANFLAADDDPGDLKSLRGCVNTGRPMGNDKFIAGLEALCGKALRKLKPGPKAKRQG
jgi:putative transposase